MARYFFDANDDHGLFRDTHGVVLADHGTALKHALLSLIRMADARGSEVGTRALTIVVRDEEGSVIRGATLWVQDMLPEDGGLAETRDGLLPR